MPIVHIHLRMGKSADYLKKVSDAIHEALVPIIKIPADDRFHIIHEHAQEAIVAHPTYGGVSRSADVIILEITLSSGRTVDIKKALYAEIVKRLETAGVRPDDVVIALTEVAKENWSFGGGRATYA
ncbi:MAG: tautomerase family protein [Thermoanaerobaculia bacterium]